MSGQSPKLSASEKLCDVARIFQNFFELFYKKPLHNSGGCAIIYLGCERLVRIHVVQAAICVDAGGCRPAIVESGFSAEYVRS